MKAENSSTLLFLTGPMRSGTTLLSDLLYSPFLDSCRHKDLLVANDDFTLCRDIFSIMRESSSVRVRQMEIEQKIDASPSCYHPSLMNASDLHLYIINKVKEHLSCGVEKKVVGFKNTLMLPEFEYFRSAGEDVKLIICTRDPRAIFSSYLERARKSAENNVLDKKDWIMALVNIILIKKYYEYYENEGGNKVIICRYEDLIADTTGTIRKIVSFLGLREDLYDFEQVLDGKVISNTSFSKIGADEIIHNSGIDKERSNGWMERIDSTDKELIDWLFSLELEELNKNVCKNYMKEFLLKMRWNFQIRRDIQKLASLWDYSI